jgi:uncharacterized protein YqeY
MNLKDRLMEDLKEAMRQGDEVRKSTVRLVRGAVKNAEIDAGHELSDEEVIAVIAREARQRRESIREFERGSRPDLVAREEAELRILEEYLPRQMTRQEIETEAQRVIGELGASGPGDMGTVMRHLMSRLKGRADGRVVNEVVMNLLRSKA